MLSLLHIENIALIDVAEITFGPGFTTLTGETGAGKSIIIDAISAVMGERTSRDLIRTGSKSALVTAIFQDLPELPWFAENGITPDENGELTLTRKIQADGKNVCRVGGIPCTVVQLRSLGSQLINIHGQHDGQQLLDETSHLGYLDNFGSLQNQVAAYHKAYETLSALRSRISTLKMDAAEKARRIDTLQYQITELERANLRPGEEEELAQRSSLLREADKLMAAVETGYLALSGSDSQEGAAGLLAQAEGALSKVSSFSKELTTLSSALAELCYAADDAVEQLRSARENLEFSPGELDDVESRLDLLYRLRKKYGATTEDMLAYLAQCRAQLDQIEVSDDTVRKLTKEYKGQLTAVTALAEALSQARKDAAEALKIRIQGELQGLDMPKVRFETEFLPKSGKPPLDETGMDEVRFLMSANVGETLKPIAKVASGGELSRIMLALKNVLAENDSIQTLIFDEVDTGVSGRAAGKVAEKMVALAKNCQVLCVTHLAQIAAMSDNHFSVQKEERDGRTYTSIVSLDRPGRQGELARLTGGDHVSKAILAGVEELLEAAEQYKKTI